MKTMKAYPELRKTAHGVGQNCVHLVWKPKYAFKVLEGEVKTECERVLRETARRYGYGVIALEVQPDHVHCFLSFPPTESVSKVLNILKGVSSRRLRQQFPSLRRRYWGGHMWSPGKFFRSVGSTTDRAVKHYIESSHHGWDTHRQVLDRLAIDDSQTQLTHFS